MIFLHLIMISGIAYIGEDNFQIIYWSFAFIFTPLAQRIIVFNQAKKNIRLFQPETIILILYVMLRLLLGYS